MSLDQATEQQAQTLFRDIWSPYCKGVSLLECPSSQAENLRSIIRQKLQAGEKPETIMATLKTEFGNTLRMQPAFEGRESLAYTIPWITFFLTVMIFLVVTLYRRKSKAKPARATTISPEPEILNKILRDLNR